MLYGIFVCFLCMTAILIISTLFERIHIVKACMCGVGMFFIEYILFASLLLGLDQFAVNRVLVICAVAHVAVLVFSIKNIIKALSAMDFDLKPMAAILLMLLVLTPFTLLKSGPISPVFDAGVYGAKTLDLIHGDTRSIKILKEYSIVPEEGRAALLELQASQIGLYGCEVAGDLKLQADQLDVYGVESPNDVYRYEYHGLPTWPAVMALSAKIFGAEQMGAFSTVFFIIIGLCIYFILERLNPFQYAKYIGCLLMCFSPVTVYLSKNILSELLFAFSIILAVFFLVQPESKLKLLSGVCFGTASFCHMAFLMYVPIICGCVFLLSILMPRQKYAYAGVNYILLALVIPSLFYYQMTTFLYAYMQFNGMLGSHTPAIVTVGALVGIAVQLCVVRFAGQRLINALVIFWEKYAVLVIRGLVAMLVVMVVAQGYRLAFTDAFPVGAGSWRFRANYSGQGLIALGHLNFINVVMATSYLTVPFILYKIFCRKTKWDIHQMLLSLVFLYSMFIYTVVSVDTPNNYTTSRYFLPVIIPCIILLGCSFLIGVKTSALLGICCIVTALPFNTASLLTPEYNGYHEMLNDMTSIIESDGIVLINPDEIYISYPLVINLREVNNNLVFHKKSLPSIQEEFRDDTIYIITTTPSPPEGFEKIFEKPYAIIGELYSLRVVYPLRPDQFFYTVYVYRLATPMSININRVGDAKITGMYAGSNWAAGDVRFALQFDARDKEYRLKIEHMALPAYLFSSHGPLNLTVYLEEEEIYSGSITEPVDGSIDIPLPPILLIDSNEHNFRLVTDTWVPMDVIPGSSDPRELGLPLEYIQVYE